MFAGKCQSGEEGIERQAQLTRSSHTFTAEYGRPGSPIQNLNLEPSWAEQYGLKIK